VVLCPTPTATAVYEVRGSDPAVDFCVFIITATVIYNEYMVALLGHGLRTVRYVTFRRRRFGATVSALTVSALGHLGTGVSVPDVSAPV